MPFSRLHSVSIASCLLALLLALAASRTHAQDAPPEGEVYRAEVQAALAAFDAGAWDEAMRHFRAAHELAPSARTQRGMGMVELSLGHYARAVELLESSLEDTRRPLTEELRESVRSYLATARAHVAWVHFAVTPAASDLQLSLDEHVVASQGTHGLLVDPGAHTVTLARAGRELRRMDFTVEAGDDRFIELSLSPVETKLSSPVVTRENPAETARIRPFRGTAIVLSAGSAALAATGLATGVSAYVRARDAHGSGATRVRKLAHTSDALFAIAGATAVTAFSLWLVRRPQREQEPRVLLAPVLGKQAVGAVIDARF